MKFVTIPPRPHAVVAEAEVAASVEVDCDGDLRLLLDGTVILWITQGGRILLNSTSSVYSLAQVIGLQLDPAGRVVVESL